MSDSPADSPPPTAWRTFALDRAVAYAVLLRGWQLAAGLVSVGLIAWRFSPDVQGYYYTFASLMALQAFFELGLSVVVVHVCSHEGAHVRVGPRGELSGAADSIARLSALGRWLVLWYALAAAAFVAVVGGGGGWYLASGSPPAAIHWLAPWGAIVLATASLLFTTPLAAMLEGCGEVTAIHRYRFWQAVAANAAVWVVIVAGGELWAVAAASLVRAGVDWLFLLGGYPRFFAAWARPAAAASYNWRREVWPLQWRTAVTGVVGYSEFALFTPILFHYHGPEAAGQMGMSWSLLFALQAAALAWVQTRIPQFGKLVAQRRFAELDRRFTQALAAAVGMMLAASLMMLAGVALLQATGWSLAGRSLAARLLPLDALAAFAAALTLRTIGPATLAYVRAFKRDPLFPWAIASGLTSAGLVWWWGAWYGALGAGLGLLTSAALIYAPGHLFAWRLYRQQWTRPDADDA